MVAVDQYRQTLHDALAGLGLGWDAFPEVVTDPRLGDEARLAAVMVLLSQRDDASMQRIRQYDPFDESLDWLGRPRGPWPRLSRQQLPWNADALAVALDLVSVSPYDDRRVGLVLRAAQRHVADGGAGASLLDALARCDAWLGSISEWESVTQMRRLVQRTVAAATPPDLLDLSLIVDGDTWASPARAAARSRPAADVAPLVRLLGELGPGRPTRRWSTAVDAALERPPAAAVLQDWIGIAARAEPVPQSPGSRIGWSLGVLFMDTNNDLVRAGCWATTSVPDPWPADLLGELARRGSAHNGAAGHPEALALAVANAAVASLAARGGTADHRALTGLAGSVSRRDVLRRIEAALASGDGQG